MLKKKKFNIFNTFDMYSCEAISIIKDKIIKFVLIEADNFFISKHQKGTDTFYPVLIPSDITDSCINTEITNNDTIYFSVLNNKRMYTLLSKSWRRYKSRLENESIKC
ncbi:MAG: hypothetical protein PHC34_05730 [Candidatus Gastranaerophilales bacterium]|nr:hypothetical protein [Candidatus Gastranaerophilales bacterium]